MPPGTVRHGIRKSSHYRSCATARCVGSTIVRYGLMRHERHVPLPLIATEKADIAHRPVRVVAKETNYTGLIHGGTIHPT